MRILAFALSLLILAGCGVKTAEPAVPRETVVETVVLQEEAAKVPPVEVPEEEPVWEERGDGWFTDAGELNTRQQEAILKYMYRYYDSLAGLERRDGSELFAEDAAEAWEKNRAVWDYVIGIRAMQEQDLSLSAYEFQLSCLSAEEQEDGSLRVMVQEQSIQNFAAYPGVDAESFRISHVFILREQDGAWRLENHLQLDSLYWMVLGRSAFRDIMPKNADMEGDMMDVDEEESLDQRLARLLSEAEAAVAQRDRGSVEAPQFTTEYDRQAAVDYALEWVGQRNEDWPDYSRYGGNCQNFVSQCLDAGGIPMDIRSPGVWKWYGTTPNSYATANGRSASWSAVKDFLEYAQLNRGYGLVSQADAPYYSGQVGDVLHLAQREGDWRHTVLISRVMSDERGETCDYLICSNTADLRNFPVSAYPYAQQMLIKIYGWNS